jgi:RNA polymerase sigma-70 factor, ECF subfamily
MMQTNEGLHLLTRAPVRPRPPISKTPDEVLIESVADGDKHALEQLFTRHSARLYRFVLRMTGNAPLSEDIVSEVFLEVWRRPARFQARSQVSTWLFAIARNKALQALRSRRQNPLDDDGAADLVDSADDPEAALHEKSRSIVLRRCLLLLSPIQREIVDLVYYHEKSVAEVAQIVGIPTGTVKTRMFRARSRIAELLAEAGLDEFQDC